MSRESDPWVAGAIQLIAGVGLALAGIGLLADYAIGDRVAALSWGDVGWVLLALGFLAEAAWLIASGRRAYRRPSTRPDGELQEDDRSSL